LDASHFSQLYFGPSLNTLQLGLPAVAGLLVKFSNVCTLRCSIIPVCLWFESV